MELAQDLAFGIYSSSTKSQIIRSYKIRNIMLSIKFGIRCFHINVLIRPQTVLTSKPNTDEKNLHENNYG